MVWLEDQLLKCLFVGSDMRPWKAHHLKSKVVCTSGPAVKPFDFRIQKEGAERQRGCQVRVDGTTSAR